jgi:uncharacterized protein (TIGR02466 family)
MKDATVENLFVTKLYRAEIPRAARLNAELEKTCLVIARDDAAGRRWAKEHNYRGYTSYASLDDLPRRAPVFAELVKYLDGHARRFARNLDFTSKLALDSLWINVMDESGVHTAHIHPHSALSGTYYVALPKRASAIRFEDPRLGLMMAAPQKRETAARANRQFVTVEPRAGTLLLWESWLRHEVPLNAARGKRISVSFNYGLRS